MSCPEVLPEPYIEVPIEADEECQARLVRDGWTIQLAQAAYA
jgi:hypothetical protein